MGLSGLDGLSGLSAICKGQNAARSYATILRDDYGVDEIWPLVDIAAGVTAPAFINSNRDGTLSGLTLQNTAGPVPGSLAPYFGTSNYVDIFTSNGSDGLVDIASLSTMTIMVWAKVENAAVWTDGADHSLWAFNSGGSQNNSWGYKNDDDSLQARFRSNTNAQLNVCAYAGTTSTGWLHITQTVTPGAHRQFVNGIEVDQVVNATVVPWAALFNVAVIGNGIVNSWWPGWLAYFAVKFGTAMSQPDILAAYNAAATAAPD